MKRAIVTGATGFVGSNLCKYLVENNWDVSIISRTSSDYTSIKSLLNRVRLFEYDGNIGKLIDFFNENKADVVFHLASLFIAEHEPCQINYLIDSNIKFGLHVLEAMKESNTKQLINTGTSWQHYQTNEYNPVDLYAATKQAFESLIKYYVDAEYIRCITLKLFDTYGETDTRPKLINLLNRFSDENIKLNLSPGEQVLDLVHIDDVVKAFVKAYEILTSNCSIDFEQFGVASGRKIRLRDLIEIFEKVTSKKINVCWGGRGYRKREVMELWSGYKLLPDWECTISLEDGLSKYSSPKNECEIN